MKVVILAGGFGSRISEESHLIPKPMIEIGEKPILWHIMKYYYSFGHKEFIVLAGYKQNYIKNYFNNYFVNQSNITFDFNNSGKINYLSTSSENWKVTIIDTGLNTMTGGRIKRIKELINEENFLLTYGDGLSNVNINDTIHFHLQNNRIATITAYQPGSRYGIIKINDNGLVTTFTEKLKDDGNWINSGFMVLNKSIFSFINGDETVFENEPLQKLASQGQLNAYKHFGKWLCMDTLRDKELLEKEWNTKNAFWKTW